MGIRKEIKQAIKDMDVRDPILAVAAIEKIVNRPKPPKTPHLIVREGEVEAKGVKLEDAPKLLRAALTMTEGVRIAEAVVSKALRIDKDANPCDNCPEKAGCPDAE